MDIPQRLREIPYNYTSFTDRDIVHFFLDSETWQNLENLRHQGQRRNEQAARMLFEVLGDMWVIWRNPYLQADLLAERKRWRSLTHALHHRLDAMLTNGADNQIIVTIANQTRLAVNRFIQHLQNQLKLQRGLRRHLKGKTRADNICFDGLSRVAHSTDATDWRVAMPLAVFKPDSANEIPHMVRACAALNLSLVPRGGGTGYTGGAVPLHAESVVMNLEKLNDVGEINYRQLLGRHDQTAVITVGAGVVTQRVAEAAEAQQLIFAVDPTSQEACTIGGNIALNAGGKMAVRWGTTIDNLVAWHMVIADGQQLHVERIEHNLGKIPADSNISFQVTHLDHHGKPLDLPKTISVAATEIRRPGLGKDVTNKFLGGVPGIQKEGCDGIITSAEFILHPKPKFTRTFCLEFFGSVKLAVPAILDIKNYLDTHAEVALGGLEHLDERYIKAVRYTTKSARSERPKMILLGDVIGEDENHVGAACAEVVRRANLRQAEGFIAVSAEARKRFYADRKRTAAIAAHTNAFKINEDVVIPLAHLAEYNDEIERINIEESTFNKLAIIDAYAAYLRSAVENQPNLSLDASHDMLDETEKNIWRAKFDHALALLTETSQRWQQWLTQIEQPAQAILTASEYRAEFGEKSLFACLQERQLKISLRDTITEPLKIIFFGNEYAPLWQKLEQIHGELRRSRLFVATHMHAGDGNVHTNIPVFSNDTAMMQRAEAIVQRVMNKAIALDGVVSGEHGIGITKLAFLDPLMKESFIKYKQQIDPQDIFNRSKLIKNIQAFTPSLNLLQQEALILEASELGELNKSIKDCLRCGKCKPDCQTHIPRANLFYSPRDKILATGAIIEAFLYEEQTRRGVSAHHFDAMNDIADHCTTCHKCFNPCPVNIDFGDVSITMRSILQKQGEKRRSLGTRLTLWYLNLTDARKISIVKRLLIDGGFYLQRKLYSLLKPWQATTTLPQATDKKPSIVTHVLHFSKKPFPKNLPRHPVRRLLGLEDPSLVPILRDSHLVTDQSEAVFYFPGCGSERLFSTVGLATLALLFEIGVQTVLPPGYLCCGYPQLAEGQTTEGNKISTANRVLFHRVANTLNYLDIKTVIVSCGTCYDQLAHYEFEAIFPGCRLLDIHEYLAEKKVQHKFAAPTPDSTTQFLYHDPCHSPIKTTDATRLAQDLLGQPVLKSNRCCGDAGTLSMSRPDIASQLRYQKQNEIMKGIKVLTGDPVAKNNNVKMLTSCPACVKGLKSYVDDTGVETDYIVVELANKLLGAEWENKFISKAQQGGIERVLL